MQKTLNNKIIIYLCSLNKKIIIAYLAANLLAINCFLFLDNKNSLYSFLLIITLTLEVVFVIALLIVSCGMRLVICVIGGAIVGSKFVV